MKPEMSDENLADDLNAQLKVITDAYASGDQNEIEQALNWVSGVRRMKAQGLYDWFHAVSYNDEPGEHD